MQTDRELRAEIKLYYDLLLPEDQTAPAPLLIAVHGYGGNKRAMMREAQALAPANFAVAVLQGFHQHWRDPNPAQGKMPKVGFAWLTDYKAEESVAVHHQAIRDLIQNLTAEGVPNAKQIFLLGFSQACALNFRFAFSNTDLLGGVIGISGGVPGDWETSETYHKVDAPVLYIYGDDDEFYPLEKLNANAAKLSLRAEHLQTKAYRGKHEITDEMRQDVKRWLQNNANGHK